MSSIEPKHLVEDNTTTLRPFHLGCESVLLDITNPAFSFREHVLIDPERKVIFSEGIPASSVLMFRHYLPADCRKISGTVAYLSNTWVDNYYHWLQLTLPLLRLYQKLAPEVKIDAYYVGRSRLMKVQEETLAAFGVRKEQIIREACQANRLLTVIYQHRPQYENMRYRDPWGHEFIRKTFCQPPAPSSPKRIYVQRRNVRNRQLKNEPQIAAFLSTLGFIPVSMDGLTVAEQARLFAGADVIIGVHGAALTNLIFARKGAKLIELFPPEVQEPGMFTAATHSGLDYYFLLGRSGGNNHAGDFTIPTDKLRALLNLAGV
jgi:capsular polysaccharide biosynthesis protein